LPSHNLLQEGPIKTQLDDSIVVQQEHTLDAAEIATAEDEHAVSKVIEGPLQPKKWLMRPAMKARSVPVAEKALALSDATLPS
jgi:hypothetical protein